MCIRDRDVSIDQDFVDDYNTSNGTNITLDNLLFDTSFTDLKQAVINEDGVNIETLQFKDAGAITNIRRKIILFFEDIILLQSEPEPEPEPEPHDWLNEQPVFRNDSATLTFQPNFVYEIGGVGFGAYIGFITQDYMRIRMGWGGVDETLFEPFPGFTASQNKYVTGDGVITGSREYTTVMHLDIHRRSLPISAGSTSNMIVEMNANRQANGLSGSSIRVWVNGLLVGNLNDDVINGVVAGSDEHGYGVVQDDTPSGSGALVDTSSTWYTQMDSSSTTKVISFLYDATVRDVSIDQDFVNDYNTSNGTLSLIHI